MDALITDTFAIYNGDCIEVMGGLPDRSVGLSVYSPPFAGLYHYSSSPRDLSNARNYDEFTEHYRFVVDEIYRLTMPGRVTAVHCCDIPSGNSGCDHLRDFPGDVIRLHESCGFSFVARFFVWKEPLAVRMRTMAKGLEHQTIVTDATYCTNAGADQVIIFRRDTVPSDDYVPVTHETGFHTYAGERTIPEKLHRFKGWKGKQTENSLSHWIWRQYASSFWDDIRSPHVLPFRDAKEPDDERHVHPLQLDVIERIVSLYSNPGDTVLTPFLGVGSEAFGAVRLGRRAVGAELKASYFKQACKNMEFCDSVNIAGDEYQPDMMDSL